MRKTGAIDWRERIDTLLDQLEDEPEILRKIFAYVQNQYICRG